MASKAGKLWKEYGALEFHECVGEDFTFTGAPIKSFAQLMKLKSDETVLFSWIIYKSKKQRDAVNKKIMQDPRLHKLMPGPLFNSKRMTYSGFTHLVDL